ncbi:MAG: SDR family NAD(P)-dependent oxidoreductase [Burkholderiales bacterium]|nr:SDR family NAD(P)-dependent oxidoreductase [Burkholderiales bacterium]
MKLENLRGKLVLVTGAGAGIGQAIAVAFARAGARLVLTDLDGARLTAVASELEAMGGRPVVRAANVADAAAMDALAAAVHAEAGALDVLVNNAGIAYLGPFVETPIDAWRRVLDVNVLGVVNGCRVFLPRMIAAGGSRRVVNVASAAAFAPALNMSAYAASKYAVMGLSDVLAMELAGTGVGVTSVCPGIIDTAITKNRANVAASISDAQLAKIQGYYQTKGVAADVVAREVVRGVQDGRDLVLVGPKARPSYHAKRISRALTSRLSAKDSKVIGFA